MPPTDDPESTRITIEQGAESIELIADSIDRLADAADALLSAGLTERALLTLLHDKTAVGKRDIRRVLHALPALRDYLDG